MNQWSAPAVAPTPEAVASTLLLAGIKVDPARVVILDREERFAARLDADRIAWFPQSAKGAERLHRETRVLALLARYCGFGVPTLVYQSPSGWQLRRMVPGTVDPFATYEHAKRDTGYAAAIGSAMGRILAEQHGKVPRSELEGWLPMRTSWPMQRGEIERGLFAVVTDRTLIARSLALIDRYEDAQANVTEQALVHSDFGFHNIVIDPQTELIAGVFDYDDAAFTDRHLDFRYLLLDIPGETLLDAAIEAYTAAGGRPIDRPRVALLNAASAVSFLAFRAGSASDEKPAGRTLTEDLTWTRLALDRAGA